jgi:hypothetical protein
MNAYEQILLKDLKEWQKKMVRKPNLFDRLSKRMQTKVNSYIPEKVHLAITNVIKQMIRGVLFGASYTVPKKVEYASFEALEIAVEDKIRGYRRTASIEGGVTGAGGILLGLADFPILIGIKLKMLFDIATMYGYDVKDYKERVFLLHIFQLAFSSQQHRREVYLQMVNWKEESKKLPDDIHQFNWRSFQQEYRDYIDLAKLAQLIPGIGAIVGLVVNYRLIDKLGKTAMNAYRMRWAEEQIAGFVSY